MYALTSARKSELSGKKPDAGYRFSFTVYAICTVYNKLMLDFSSAKLIIDILHFIQFVTQFSPRIIHYVFFFSLSIRTVRIIYNIIIYFNTLHG